jgi:hypothetical protein
VRLCLGVLRAALVAVDADEARVRSRALQVAGRRLSGAFERGFGLVLAAEVVLQATELDQKLEGTIVELGEQLERTSVIRVAAELERGAEDLCQVERLVVVVLDCLVRVGRELVRLDVVVIDRGLVDVAFESVRLDVVIVVHGCLVRVGPELVQILAGVVLSAHRSPPGGGLFRY